MARHWSDELRQDIRFAARTLWKNPAFSIAAVLTLGLGIGAMTAILSVVNGVMLRTLPYPNADRAVLLWQTFRPNGGNTASSLPFSASNFVDVRDRAKTFERVAAFKSGSLTFSDDGGAELLSGARVSDGVFEALGVAPFLGRTFTREDDRFGAEPVVILSYALWRRRFGADPSIVGRTIKLSDVSHTVVGVMPPGFAFPRGAELPAALMFGARTEAWTPLALSPGMLEFRGTQNISVIALPRRGASAATVAQDLDQVMQGLAEQYPNTNQGAGARAVGLLEGPRVRVGPALYVLLGGVSFLLLIACANVSNLLLTRTISRSREVAIRGALGAGPGRLIRQFVTENLALAAAGGIVGIFVAIAGKGGLFALVPANLPRRDDISVDWRVLGAIVAIVGAVGIVLGALTVAHLLAGNRVEELREGGRSGAGAARSRLRSGLAVLEIAISVVLLVGAVTLGRTFLNLRNVAPGFERDGVMTARVSLPIANYDFGDIGRLGPSWTRFYRLVTDQLAGAPGLDAAGAITSLPLSGAWENTGFGIVGRPSTGPGDFPNAFTAGVTEGYFKALRIPLIRGRLFGPQDRDSTTSVVIISEALAKKYWDGQDPIGAQLRIFGTRPAEIIGVVGDVRQTELSAPAPAVLYLPLSLYVSPTMALVTHGSGDPRSQEATIRERIRAIDPNVPVTEVRAMDDVMAQSLAQQRFSATLIGAFATAALVLAILGLYGVISFGVARRAREIGVRLALGAEPAAVLRLVLREGAALALGGVAAGLAGALALGRLLSSLVFGVTAANPLTLIGVAAIMGAVTLAATVAPARRAMAVDPVITLRSE